MKIITNPNKGLVKEIREELEKSKGFCPCRLDKTPGTKCMCKEFRDQIKQGIEGECHCGLYIAYKESRLVYDKGNTQNEANCKI